jgi:hypothetical protein
MTAEASGNKPGFLRRLYLRAIVPPDPFRFDPRLDRLVVELCRDADVGRPVLNLGSGSTAFGPGVVNLDLRCFPGVAVCGTGESLPFRSQTFAGALLRGVLEHVQQVDAVRAEVERVLRTGAFLYVEVPFLQPFHESPDDYRRFTLPGLRTFLSSFNEVESGVQIGPGSSLAWVARETIASLLSFGSPRVYPKVLTLAGWATFWLKYLDPVIVPAAWVERSASAIYYLGRKRG